MSQISSAIHVRTGEPSAAEAIEGWLRAHDVESVVFFDVYDACVYLLQHNERVPDLVFVGTDWLAPDELSIIRFIRETWPGAGIVAYSSSDEAPPVPAAPPTCVCRTPAALLQFMTEPPAQALRRLRAQAAPEAARVPSPQPAGTRHSAPRAPQVPPVPQPTRAPRSTAADQDFPDAAPDRTAQADLAPPAIVPPGAVLTADELSALLDEEDGH